jgi:hypothetical protein
MKSKYVGLIIGRASHILISALKRMPHAPLDKQPCIHKQRVTEPQNSSGSLGEQNSFFHITEKASQFLFVDEPDDLT